ncbi:cadherin-like domain-containing protein [Sulfitobacter sp. S190]|uniref:cadherin-like domain-containing protein n=1 Tax=Sulfitobacter sp. S190 TaxID=2867022 RepID=UPI0021FADBDE|nr:cadherin-like domain-containing protein [Sulfitobacter sp. S190]UWR20910.1 tandem-95 repeat protein [Sulfitobacter sp. S190]
MIRTINFNDLTAGTTVTDQFADEGVAVSAVANGNGSDEAMIFDTSNPTGQDEDLATSNLGNVLIISEDSDATDPDDNASGGTFSFDFTREVEVKSLTFLDLEQPARLVFFNDAGDVIAEQFVPANGDNSQLVVELDVEGTGRLDVVLQGSGAIDDLVYDDPAADAELDGIVSGDDTADVIDLEYTGDPEGDMIDAADAVLAGEAADDDIVDARGGDDLVQSLEGDDDVYAGAGDDTVEGGAGDDLIFGDRTLAEGNDTGGEGARESFNWSALGLADGEDITSTSQQTGDATVTLNIVGDTDKTATSFATNTQTTAGIEGGDETVDANSSAESDTSAQGEEICYELSFDQGVTDVDFNINDVDGSGIVQVTAFDADGNAIPVTLTGGANIQLVDTDGVNGPDTACSTDGGFADDDNGIYAVNVDIVGPVSRVVIKHTQGGEDSSDINITDVFFTTGTPEPVAGGDDSLLGGAGDDTILGEGGDDTLEGGSGDDSLLGGTGDDSFVGGTGADVISGGADSDTITGGTGGDVVDGGTTGDDRDVLDLSDAGPLRVVDETVDEDGDSTSGTIEFLGDDGEVIDTLTFTEIEELILPENTGPNAVDDEAETDEDTTVIIPVLTNDTDPEGDALSVTAASSDDGDVSINDDGTLSFTPAPDFNGSATIDYTITDGNGGSDTATVTVDVAPVNDAPVAVDDSDETTSDTAVTIPVLDNDSDVDGDALSVTSATSADGDVVINDDGTITFTPNPDFSGDATIDYTISDRNGGTDDAVVTVAVEAVNAPPVARDDSDETDEDTAVTIDILGNDSDPDGDALTVTAATSPDGDVVINDDGTVTFTPDADFNGEATIDYTITDGNGGEDTAQVSVTVNPVNDAPVAEDDADTTDEDTTVTITVLDNDSDVDGDPLSVIAATSPDGDVTINDDGTIDFTPNPDFNGTATIDYTISDGNGGEDSAQVEVTVDPVNDAPVAEDDSATLNKGDSVTVSVLDNDSDPDGDPLSVTAATSPDGDVTINDDGTLTFTPDPDFCGDTVINYTLSDGTLTDDAVVAVTVRDGIVSGTEDGDLIDVDYVGDPEGDLVDAGDAFLPGEEPQDDIIEAGDGDDTVRAGLGNDEVSGGEGNDDINGETGDDVLDGDAGDDTITGGDGSDTVSGGDGDDSIVTGNGDVLPDIGFPGVFDPDPLPDNDRDSVDGGAGSDTIRTGDDRDTITGGDGNDVINAGIDDDEVQGNDGDDRIVGGEGNDDILGGAGNDTIFAGNDPDEIPDGLDIEDDGSNPLGPDPVPGNGRDTVDGGAGDDVIFGADDDDLLIGGAGDDLLDGEIDDDTLRGDAGDDTLIGGQGDDLLVGGDDNDSLSGGIGDDTANGGSGDDTIDGGDGADSLSGGRGNDTIEGGAGNDTLRGNREDDSLHGGDGDDLLDGGADNDQLSGDAGDDTLLGVLGDDTLSGGAGDDELRGGSGDDVFDGGTGDDTMIGGADRDNFSNVNAGDIVDGSESGVDEDCLDLTGSAPEGGRLEILPDPADPDNEENGIVQYYDADGMEAGQLIFSNIEKIIPCFTPGTLIATPKGERPVEDLEVGDRVITRDNGMQEIRWVGQREMSGEELAAKAHLRPVLIQQGALGNGLPERDMMVSPQHRVLVANDKTALYFEEREVLVAAKHLTDMDGIDVVDTSGTTYVHIMFDQHEVILSDGTWTESFQPGDMSLAGVGDASLQEILELFPELATRSGIDAYASARRSLKKHEAKLITL